MRIEITKNLVDKSKCNIAFDGDGLSYVATNGRLFISLSWDELTQLADFANAELKDLGVANV